MTKPTETQDQNKQTDSDQQLTDSDLNIVVGGMRMQAAKATTGGPISGLGVGPVTDMQFGMPTDLNFSYTNL